jgi:hypothetical protein
MLDNQARLASGLTKEEYLFVMENFNDLREASQSFDANEYLLKQVDGN